MAARHLISTLLFFLVNIGNVRADETLVVKTSHGKIRGTSLSIPDHKKEALAFLGVPYSAPPVDDFRFMPPQPMESWEGIRDATKHGPPCTQALEAIQTFLDIWGLTTDVKGVNPSEDCLTLDVYTSSLTGKKPVMVYIHGGGFFAGWSSLYDMRVYPIRHDVVGVVIQYRLGPLGWLSTGDDVIKGNMGFQDQVAALKWVQQNIASFGGDPNQVTIFGQSAGSLAVSMHLLSPLSRGLFNRAILHSGSIYNSQFLSPPVDAKDKSVRLGKLLDCPVEDTTQLASCLKSKSATEIIYARDETMGLLDPLWVVRISEPALPNQPSMMFNNGDYNQEVDIMCGVTEIEGYFVALLNHPSFKEMPFNISQFRAGVLGLVTLHYPDHADIWEDMVDAAVNAYLHQDDVTEEGSLKHAFSAFLGDGFLSASTYATALTLSETGSSTHNLYFYEFAHRGKILDTPDYLIADHQYDIPHVFGSSYSHSFMGMNLPETTQDNKLMDDIMMKYWTNFARNGDPNDNSLKKWPDFRDNHSYLALTTTPTDKQNYQENRMNYWLKKLPLLIKNKNREEL